MARYVLLKLEDAAAEKFVKKAGKKVLGVWDAPGPYCGCAKDKQAHPSNWGSDADTEQRFCLVCGGAYKPITSLATRLRIAFLSRNQVARYR